MRKLVEITYLGIEAKKQYEDTIQLVLEKCFETEKMEDTNLSVSITLTNPENIQKMNRQYRNIDKATDVLSFPMFEQEELQEIINQKEHMVADVLGDIVISISKVEEQAKEYGHSFERELAYMVVHGFYHLMGYDHIKEEDKKKMRPKEEAILNELNIKRGSLNDEKK